MEYLKELLLLDLGFISLIILWVLNYGIVKVMIFAISFKNTLYPRYYSHYVYVIIVSLLYLVALLCYISC